MNFVDCGRYTFKSTVSQNEPGDLDAVEIAFVGGQVDDRGTATTSSLREKAQSVVTLNYDAHNPSIYLDGVQKKRADISSLIEARKRILLDTTTLGLGEILQILLAAERAGCESLEFLYVEPGNYTQRKSANPPGLQLRDFSLTSNCQFVGVHGFAHEHDPNKKATHLFFLGFEPARVRNALEQRGDLDLDRYHCHMIIGVPAFQAGWETNTIRPHLSLLAENEITEKSITYCQANSIREAYLTLWELYNQLSDERENFFISPLGTKPHAVGAALFLLETKGNDIPTSLYYDHPVRVGKRSSDVATWHHVRVQIR